MTCMKSHAITGICKALWKIVLAIKLLLLEYKKFISYCIAFILSNSYLEAEREKSDEKYNYISLYFNNILGKLIKYQELLLELPAYIAFIATNLTFCWR